MSAVQVFAAGYLFGAAVFGIGLILIMLRLVIGETQIAPAIPLIGGCALMFTSKFALMSAQRKAGRK